MTKPNPKDYGWEDPTPYDEGGWTIEGGEEKFYLHLSEYEIAELKKTQDDTCGALEDTKK
ncbi:MAG: hypothetical protein JNL70_25835 [Saprospiraceae bacterium]|nr:hypothetical protein [Saprospiraceae bacterium]